MGRAQAVKVYRKCWEIDTKGDQTTRCMEKNNAAPVCRNRRRAASRLRRRRKNSEEAESRAKLLLSPGVLKGGRRGIGGN